MLFINLTSIFVSDVNAALEFYTNILGFKSKVAVPEVNYYTVVSPANENGTQLLLEPNDNPIAKKYQEALVKQGIPITSFGTDNILDEHARLKSFNVEFILEPTKSLGAIIAIFKDGFGNLIQIAEVIED